MTNQQISDALQMSGGSPKLCPFCGGLPIAGKKLRDGCKDGEPDAWAHFVRCVSCAAQGGWTKNPHGAIRMWDMRVGK